MIGPSIQDEDEDEDIVARVKFEGDRKYARYAANVYIASWKWTWDEIAKTMEVEADDILFTWFDDDDKEHCPKFMVLVDHDLSAVVIIIRGTFSFKDVVMDVVCEEVEFQDGFAHTGFLEGSQAVIGKCREILETALSSYPEYELVVCGHSMGGATAALVTMQLLCSQEYQYLLQGHSVRCVALGSPPVFRPENNLSTDILNNINIYVNSQDVVPSLSIGSVAHLIVSLREVDRLGLTLEEQVGVLMNREGTSEDKNRIKKAVESVKQDEYPYLHHPGQVMMMTSRGERVEINIMMVEKMERMVTSLEMDERMIADHLYTNYKEIFSKDVL